MFPFSECLFLFIFFFFDGCVFGCSFWSFCVFFSPGNGAETSQPWYHDKLWFLCQVYVLLASREREKHGDGGEGRDQLFVAAIM